MKPPVPRTLDLRHTRLMPLDVVKLLNSDTWALATGDEAKAAMTLWARAWHQVPAGSLPDDERLLAVWSGSGSNWPNVREVALRGFTRSDDGRLYHSIICEAATQVNDRAGRFRRFGQKGGKVSANKRKMAKLGLLEPSSSYASFSLARAYEGEGEGEEERKKENKSTSQVQQSALRGADAPSVDSSAPDLSAYSPSPDLSDQRTQLYHRGKEVLGKSAGGQITRLLASVGGKVATARAMIETASTKADPGEYLAAAIRHRDEDAAAKAQRDPYAFEPFP